jgi:hypothetical protein
MNIASNIRHILNIFEDIGHQFTTDQFSFDKVNKRLIASSTDLGLSGFPQSIKVKSVKTGREVTFVVDKEAAINAEFWDGEMCEYIPVNTKKINVEKLVITAE